MATDLRRQASNALRSQGSNDLRRQASNDLNRQGSNELKRQVSMVRRAAPTLETLTGKTIRVRPTSRALVVPTVRTEEHWLPLSNLDRVVNPTFSSVILFYTNLLGNSELQFQDVTNALKGSLAKTLVHFYPLAGRLALGEDGKVDILCNNEGAVWIEASVDTELSAVGGPKPMPSLSGMEVAGVGPGPRYVPDQITTMPGLIIQVTKFKCGSVAVAANWHHTIADGSSGCHFMKTWAEMGAGLEQPSVLPNHDRMLLKPRETLDPSIINNVYSNKETEEVKELPMEKKLPSEPAVLSSFSVGKSAVLELKEKVTLEDEEGRQFTSAESISAHLWRQMTKARADSTEPSDRDSKTRFFMFVDGRKKMNLPGGYFGNVVCSACATATEEDILSKPAAHAAALVRKAVRDISGEYFRSLIDWVEAQGGAPSKAEHVNSLGRDVAATFWNFFPLYEMDFGWGKPGFAARNSPARPLIDGIAMMPSPKGPGNMVALLNLHGDRMARLQKQASFKVLCSAAAA